VERAIRFLGGAGGAALHRNGGKRRLLFGLLRRAILVEAIGAQFGAEGEIGRRLGRLQLGRRRVAEIERDGRLALAGAVEMRDEAAARSCKSRASTASGLPSPATTMRLNGRLGGPMIAISRSFCRGNAAPRQPRG